MPTLWLLNVREVGERLTAETPEPARLAVWGLFVALSVTVKVALRDPAAVGVKVTSMVQAALAAKVEGLIGQLLV